MKHISVIIETFKSPDSQAPLSGSKKTILVEDTVNTAELLLAEIKNQSNINRMTSEKIFINGTEATGAIELDEITGVKYAGYVKASAETKVTSHQPTRPSPFLGVTKDQFLAAKRNTQ